jgi:arylsulfatase A-like enzyme
MFATIAELAGAKATTATDSISFASLLKRWCVEGQYAYSELFGSTTPKGQSVPDAWSIRNTQYQMVQFVNRATELYDLSKDPLETTDLMADPASAAIVAQLTSGNNGARRVHRCDQGVEST